MTSGMCGHADGAHLIEPIPLSHLRSARARRWGRDDDLTNGAWLDQYCPRGNRVSDIDSEPGVHVLHNRWRRPHREVQIEYKRIASGQSPLPLSRGQSYLIEDRPGTFARQEDGLLLIRRFFLISHEGMEFSFPPLEVVPGPAFKILDIKSPDELARVITDWIWVS